MREAKLKIEKKNIIIKEIGKTKEEALGKIFASFRKKVQENIDGVILKLEPIETYLIDIKEEKKIEKFLEVFMPREKTVYCVELEIEYEVKYIKI
ncbi:DUF4312 family protein [Fusobacterium sp.]|uniref:DUF4312 family protein n=1 Tax=Fusobacterium sp. TaxID=68766 RepID=UPI0025C01D5B|nr:DUF4312 family protein [Fusobacterium sp.]